MLRRSTFQRYLHYEELGVSPISRKKHNITLECPLCREMTQEQGLTSDKVLVAAGADPRLLLLQVGQRDLEVTAGTAEHL